LINKLTLTLVTKTSGAAGSLSFKWK